MDTTPWVLVAAVGAEVIGATRVATALTRKHRRRKALDIPASVDDSTRGRPRPQIVMDPSRHENPQAFKDRINRKAKEFSVNHTYWHETTREDPNTDQTARALGEGTTIMIAAGGDGTVRAVAADVAGSGVHMGIIPVDTDNILAGSLSVPDDPKEALAVTLDHNHRAVDLAWVRIEDATQKSTRPAGGGLRLTARTALRPGASTADQGAPASSNEPHADEYACLVIAGMGYDGATMVDTNLELKKHIGWITYMRIDLGAIGVPYMKTHLTLRSPTARVADPLGVDGQITRKVLDEASSANAEPLRPPADEIARIRARSVMFADTGELKILVLAPDVEPSDGLIGVIAVDALASLLGWTDVTWRMLGQLIGLHPINLPVSIGEVTFRQTKDASIMTGRAQAYQVNDDAIGLAHTVHIRIQAGALGIAVPAKRMRIELLSD